MELFQVACVLFFAVILDGYFAEPRRLHPLVGLGNMARLLEKNFVLRGMIKRLIMP